MKERYLLIVFFILFFSNIMPAKTCVVNYHIRNYPNFKLIDVIGEGAGVMYYSDKSGKLDGTFKIEVDEPMRIAIATSHTYPYKIAMLWIHEGIIDVTIDSNMDFTFKNSPLNDEYLVFRKYRDSIMFIEQPIMDKIYSDTTLSTQQTDSLNAIIDYMEDKYSDFQYHFLLNKNASFLSLDFLYFYVPTQKYDRQKLETLFNTLDTSLYKYATYKNIKSVIAVTHKKYEEGDTIDYLPLTDLKGKSVDFSKLLGKKYIYIVNWATGCHACAPNNEKLKIAYKKLKSKIIVIGIAEDSNKKSLLETIKRDKLKWENYCDFKGMLSIPNMLLNCDFTPNGTLVAPNGKIIKKNISPIKDVDVFVKEINALMQ